MSQQKVTYEANKPARLQQMRNNYQEHRAERLAKSKIYSVKYCLELKTEVLTHYGNGKCACVQCGFDNIKALSIDHINGGGGKHRKESNITHFYNWLKKNNYPTGFQTLCLNCQFIKRYDAKEQYKKIRESF